MSTVGREAVVEALCGVGERKLVAEEYGERKNMG